MKNKLFNFFSKKQLGGKKIKEEEKVTSNNGPTSRRNRRQLALLDNAVMSCLFFHILFYVQKSQHEKRHYAITGINFHITDYIIP